MEVMGYFQEKISAEELQEARHNFPRSVDLSELHQVDMTTASISHLPPRCSCNTLEITYKGIHGVLGIC